MNTSSQPPRYFRRLCISMCFSVFIAFLFFTYFFIFSISGAETVHVPEEAATLAKAYLRVKENGTILLKHGKHYVPEALIITKDVTILGDETSPESVILQGESDSVLYLKSGKVKIAGVTVQNSGKNSFLDKKNAAVQVTARHSQFHRCIFTSLFGNGFSAYKGESLLQDVLHAAAKNDSRNEESHPAPEMTDCTARRCGGTGFFLGEGVRGIFRNCRTSENTEDGMFTAFEKCEPTMEKCTFYDSVLISFAAGGTFRDCDFRGGLSMSKKSFTTFEKCTFSGGIGVMLLTDSRGTFRGCTFGPASGMNITGGTPTVEGCTFRKNRVGVTADSSSGGTFRNNKFLENRIDWNISDRSKLLREGNSPNE